MMHSPKIVIVGMGPCGLGAAWRLQELGHNNYKIFEKSFHAGGLASSFVDENGFTWDIGSHVAFSRYSYYDNVLEQLLPPNEWLHHERSSWIWMKDRFIPYPFQNNLRYLPQSDLRKCIDGVLAAQENFRDSQNYGDWIYNTFGEGIADLFMIPYNRKIWAFPAQELSFEWIGERVATPDLRKILRNVLLETDDISFGPDQHFLFPLKGSTGEIWKRLHARLDPSKSFFGYQLKHLSTADHVVSFENGAGESYDVLISTIPMDRLLLFSDFPGQSSAAQLFKHSSTHIVGIGLEGTVPDHLREKSWMYFPEAEIPFYRVTVFSNYSPYNVPDATRFWSLMAEVAESPVQPIDRSTLREQVIEGLVRCSLIPSPPQIATIWYHYEPYGYPTPFLMRKDALVLNRNLGSASVYSRGRFGGWKYEVSNQDHSFMQGVEVVNRVLLGEPERTFRC